ncbi:tetratricopeptide repeat protein [Streptomyces sp. NBC_01239]|uniref:tetratricopeptide repeat protein n=1 Tax=Streptomyces sp. NBC_01239 TaxID=2903792 RepID=UPI00224E9050|nr:tetratricopeptide repeat protein [Streptomyces sp. NBC_01239]MCX4816468.1 tetratricopeptide repeat protein [Streptomyces sp. NBC_01239]
MPDNETTQSLRDLVRTARLRLADSAADLGTLLRLLGEHDQAEGLLRQALEIYEADCRTHVDQTRTTKEPSSVLSASKPSSSAAARRVLRPDTT